MAKKARTPPPPRSRQQGPRRREPTRVPPWSDRRLLVGGGAVLVAIALIAITLASRGGGGASAASARRAATVLTAAGCTFRTYPSQGRDHVQSLDAKVDYNSFPPTSGRHYFQPAVWNRYSQPLVLVQEVHNLEHGGVIIQYGDEISPATVQQLTSFYDSSPNAMLLAPLPKLGGKIALTAWTRLAACTRFSQRAFKAFRDTFRGKGPEGFPVSALTPGS
ncbi:MAG: DUF3105 domain-containing protein [Actinobacteria bacterium]|nr:MAG: DUF3105 domain-containing protein [Actinomycetota bacterium]